MDYVVVFQPIEKQQLPQHDSATTPVEVESSGEFDELIALSMPDDQMVILDYHEVLRLRALLDDWVNTRRWVPAS